MRWILLLYLIANPLFFLCGYDSRDAQQLFYQLSSVAVFACGLFFPQNKLRLTKLNAAIGALILSFLLAWIRVFNALPPEGAPRWYIAMNLLFGVMVYLTIIRTVKKDDLRFIVKGLFAFSLFCVAVLAFQYLGYDFRGGTIWRGMPVVTNESIFFQKSFMGMYFANNSPLFLPVSYFSPALFLIPIFISQSSAALAGFSAAILFFLWFRKRVLFWVTSAVLFCAIVAALILVPNIRNEALNSIGIRIPVWGRVIQDTAQNPLGYGLDSFANPVYEGHWKYYNYFEDGAKNFDVAKAIKINGQVMGYTENDAGIFKKAIDKKGQIMIAEHPHNEYLWLTYEAGIQSLIILCFIFYFIWERFKFSRKDAFTCSFAAFLVCFAIEAFFQFPVHASRVGSALPVMLAFFYISTEEDVKNVGII